MIVTVRPTAPMATATTNAVATAVTARSALQVSGGQLSRKAREKNPKIATTTPSIAVRTSAMIETARSVPDIAGRAATIAGLPMPGWYSLCNTATMRRALLVLAALAVLVSGCGGATLKPEGAAKSVVDVVSRQTKFKPTDVSCPSGVDAKVGVEFDCKFTGPEGKEYTAHMKVTKIDGDNVDYYIESKPS